MTCLMRGAYLKLYEEFRIQGTELMLCHLALGEIEQGELRRPNALNHRDSPAGGA